MLLLPLFHSATGIIHTIIGGYKILLLMIISEYLTFNENREIDAGFVWKRVKKLMLPFPFCCRSMISIVVCWYNL